MPDKLYESVVEVDERLYLDQDACQLNLEQYPQVVGTNGQTLRVAKKLNLELLRQELVAILGQGIKGDILKLFYLKLKCEVDLKGQRII